MINGRGAWDARVAMATRPGRAHDTESGRPARNSLVVSNKVSGLHRRRSRSRRSSGCPQALAPRPRALPTPSCRRVVAATRHTARSGRGGRGPRSLGDLAPFGDFAAEGPWRATRARSGDLARRRRRTRSFRPCCPLHDPAAGESVPVQNGRRKLIFSSSVVNVSPSSQRREERDAHRRVGEVADTPPWSVPIGFEWLLARHQLHRALAVAEGVALHTESARRPEEGFSQASPPNG